MTKPMPNPEAVNSVIVALLREMADWFESADGIEVTADKGFDAIGVNRSAILWILRHQQVIDGRGFDLLASATTCFWGELPTNERSLALTALSHVAMCLREVQEGNQTKHRRG